MDKERQEKQQLRQEMARLSELQQRALSGANRFVLPLVIRFIYQFISFQFNFVEKPRNKANFLYCVLTLMFISILEFDFKF